MQKLLTTLNDYQPPNSATKEKNSFAVNKKITDATQQQEQKHHIKSDEQSTIIIQENKNFSGKPFSQTSTEENKIDSEWIETDYCTYDKYIILDSGVRLSSTGVNSDAIRECSQGLSLLAAPLYSELDVKPSSSPNDNHAASADAETVRVQLIPQSKGFKIVNNFFNILILLLFGS